MRLNSQNFQMITNICMTAHDASRTACAADTRNAICDATETAVGDAVRALRNTLFKINLVSPAHTGVPNMSMDDVTCNETDRLTRKATDLATYEVTEDESFLVVYRATKDATYEVTEQATGEATKR